MLEDIPARASLVSFETINAGAVIALITALLLLFVSGFVSASEIAFFSLSPTDLKKISDKEHVNDMLVSRLLSDSQRLLATILIANNFVNVAIIMLFDIFFSTVLSFGAPWLEFVVLTVILTFLLLLFGEIAPKLYASGNPLSFSRRSAPLMNIFQKFFWPVASLLMKSSFIADRFAKRQDYDVSVDDLETALELTDKKEIKDEHQMLEGIIKFGDETVADIMTSRVDMDMLDIRSTFKEVMDSVAENVFSRIPVYSHSSDDIRGILYIKDLLPHLDKNEHFHWQTLIRPAFFVPDTRRLDDLLHDFQSNRIHIAIVVDEFGGTEGLVTLEDVIEEILGEINDEYDDNDTRYFKKLAPHKFQFDGKTPLTDFYRLSGQNPEDFETIEGDADTLAGLLLEIKGDFPNEYEVLEYNNIKFTITKMDGMRIASVEVYIED